MKKIFLLLFAVSLSCTEKKQEEEVTYSSPQAVVTAMTKAMNDRDSNVLKSILSRKTKESILSQIHSMNGFKSFFNQMKGISFQGTVIGVDSTSPKFTKVFTN